MAIIADNAATFPIITTYVPYASGRLLIRLIMRIAPGNDAALRTFK